MPWFLNRNKRISLYSKPVKNNTEEGLLHRSSSSSGSSNSPSSKSPACGIPLCKTAAYQRKFQYRIVNLWNSSL